MSDESLKTSAGKLFLGWLKQNLAGFIVGLALGGGGVFFFLGKKFIEYVVNNK